MPRIIDLKLKVREQHSLSSLPAAVPRTLRALSTTGRSRRRRRRSLDVAWVLKVSKMCLTLVWGSRGCFVSKKIKKHLEKIFASLSSVGSSTVSSLTIKLAHFKSISVHTHLCAPLSGTWADKKPLRATNQSGGAGGWVSVQSPTAAIKILDFTDKKKMFATF